MSHDSHHKLGREADKIIQRVIRISRSEPILVSTPKNIQITNVNGISDIRVVKNVTRRRKEIVALRRIPENSGSILP